MVRRILALLPILTCLGGGPTFADGENGTQSRENDSDAAHSTLRTVEIETGSGRCLQAMLAMPEASQPVHAVILVHENRGLTAWERGLAAELAAAGFLVIAPDFLSEMGPDRGGSDSFESPAAAREEIYNLSIDQVQADLDAVIDYVSGLPESDKKVALLGFGWGGGQAFRCAARNPRLAAVLVFDGAAPTEDQLKQLAVPVYGFYGELDLQIAGEVPKVKARLKELDKSYQPVTYPGAGHAFFRAGAAADAKPADRKARSDAWTRVREVLSGM